VQLEPFHEKFKSKNCRTPKRLLGGWNHIKILIRDSCDIAILKVEAFVIHFKNFFERSFLMNLELRGILYNFSKSYRIDKMFQNLI